MKIIETPLAGLIVIEPTLHKDNRGYFFEIFHEQHYAALNLPAFVQDNFSRSKRDVLRGMHYQFPRSQGKLVHVTHGSVWDVVVDLRVNSPTFKQWYGITLSDENHLQMYIPPGFAHGFLVLSEEADFCYKCTDFYTPTNECGLAWNDKEINIPWPIKQPIVSTKDAVHPTLREIAHECLFT